MYMMLWVCLFLELSWVPGSDSFEIVDVVCLTYDDYIILDPGYDFYDLFGDYFYE